jgi:hypothetical protein
MCEVYLIQPEGSVAGSAAHLQATGCHYTDSCYCFKISGDSYMPNSCSVEDGCLMGCSAM